MKLILKNDNENDPIKISISIADDTNIAEMIDRFVGLLIAYGFSPEIINKVIIEKANELSRS